MMPWRCLEKQLLFVTGKGGIGKTLITAALGQSMAEAGRRVLLIESASHDQLAPVFGLPATGHHETLIAPRLHSINLDPGENFREYVVKYLGLKSLYDNVFNNRVVSSFIKTIPGLNEVMMLGRIFYNCELAPQPRPDLVVFDAYASGHFLSLMTTPDAVLATELGGPLARETQRVRDFLADRSRCGVIYVVTPEALVVSECLDFLPRLHAASPAALTTIVVNRVPAPTEALQTQGGKLTQMFLEQRQNAAALALKTLLRGVEQLRVQGMQAEIVYLPDIGFVDEPWPAGFGLDFLARSDAAAAWARDLLQLQGSLHDK